VSICWELEGCAGKSGREWDSCCDAYLSHAMRTICRQLMSEFDACNALWDAIG
jgi:hypothetical protein